MTRSAPRAVSRRAVVRTAGHTAWVAPAIVVVGAVPAYAASGPADVSATLAPPVRAATTLPIVVNLANANTQPSTNLRLAVRIQIPTAQSIIGIMGTEPNGWSQVAQSFDDVNKVTVFTYLAAAQIGGTAGNPTKQFSVVYTLPAIGQANAAGNVRATPLVDAPGTSTPSTQQSFA